MKIDEIKRLAWVGDAVVKGPIRGVVVVLHGLNVTSLKLEAWPEDQPWGAVGLLPVFPYYGPWCWMNRQARDFVDELMDSIYREYAIPNTAPLISIGDSMGGLATLLHARYAVRRTVTRCCAIYPVCDLPYHYTERVDVPRTVRNAYWGYKEPLAEVLIEHSPLHQVDKLPPVPYLILHGALDNQVNKEKHSDRLVPAMKKRGLDVQYLELPTYGHGGPLPAAAEEAKMKFVMGT